MQADLTRPIIGIENRTAQEVFDIMCDRIRSAEAKLAGGEAVAWQYRYNGVNYVTDSESQARQGFDVTPLYPTPEGRSSTHPDDLAVDRFAVAMKAKLAKKRAEGRGGWDNRDECTAEHLSYLLVRHIIKGDPLDVGNLAMMLHQRGDCIVIDDETRSIASALIHPAPTHNDGSGGRHPLEAYADSYAQMARDGDGAVDCRSVEIDIRQNMMPATRGFSNTSGEVTEAMVQRALASLAKEIEMTVPMRSPMYRAREAALRGDAS